MSWDTPDWWAFLLLALAAFRVWRLLAEDDIAAGPRARVNKNRPKLEYWISCPWCAGFWIAVAWWLAWVASHRWAAVAATPFAVSAIVGLVAANIDPD